MGGLKQEVIFELYQWEAINTSNIHEGLSEKYSKMGKFASDDVRIEHGIQDKGMKSDNERSSV